eukprot:gene7187-11499_t
MNLSKYKGNRFLNEEVPLFNSTTRTKQPMTTKLRNTMTDFRIHCHSFNGKHSKIHLMFGFFKNVPFDQTEKCGRKDVFLVGKK